MAPSAKRSSAGAPAPRPIGSANALSIGSHAIGCASAGGALRHSPSTSRWSAAERNRLVGRSARCVWPIACSALSPAMTGGSTRFSTSSSENGAIVSASDATMRSPGCAKTRAKQRRPRGGQSTTPQPISRISVSPRSAASGSISSSRCGRPGSQIKATTASAGRSASIARKASALGELNAPAGTPGRSSNLLPRRTDGLPSPPGSVSKGATVLRSH